MSARRSIILSVPVATVAALIPMNAELALAMPVAAAASLLAVVGFLLLIAGRTTRHQWAGAVLCAAAAVSAPIPCAVFALAPGLQRRLGRARWVLLAASFAGAAALAVLRMSGGAAYDRLLSDPADKLLEASSLVAVVIESLAAPRSLPWLGPPMARGHELGTAVWLLGVVAVGWLLARGVTRRWHGFLAATSLAVLSAVSGALLDRPRPAYGAVLGWTVVAAAVATAGLALGALRARKRLAACLCGLAALVPWTSSALPALRDRAGVWKDAEAGWARVLGEHPATAYRWEYAEDLKRCGRLDAYRDQLHRLYVGGGGDAARRSEFALSLLNAGDEDRALPHFVALGNRSLPASVKDAARILALLQSRGEWDLTFDLLARRPDLPEDVQLRLAREALDRRRTDVFDTTMRRLLERGRPGVRTFELAYRDAWSRQDVERLRAIGRRARLLYPGSWVGYAAEGKAAKIHRRDEEMLTWHRQALSRDDGLFDLHYDIGLVLHGRAGRVGEAAEHYARVLELCPDHPRRAQIEAWIAALRAEAKGAGG